MSDSILVEHRDEVAWIILNDPERRNPLTPGSIPRMLGILEELEADDKTRVVVLTGRGSAFCAGAEMGTVLSTDEDEIPWEAQFRLARGFNRIIRRMRATDLPIIGALNGVAVGGGAALALACDFSVASEKAALMFAFGRVGLAVADMGCTWMLSRLVGPARAAHLLLTGAKVGAQQGLELGLFVDVVAPEALEEAANRLAQQVISANNRRSAGATKIALGIGEGIDLSSSLEYEAYVQSYMLRTAEHRDRLAKFLKK
jgi:2-(1,2-epoxy-1,2-dihydrophenyl)acetyl-CoA isomerase